MKRLILHAGLAKTGTTSLQTWLDLNTRYLSANHTVYSERFKHNGSAHHKIATLAKEGQWDDLAIGFESLSNEGAENIICSSEELCTLTEIDIKKLYEVMYLHFDQIDIFFSIRFPFSLLLSSYKQQIREGFIKVGLADFWNLAKRQAKFLKLTPLIQPWQAYNKNSIKGIHIVCTENKVQGFNGDIIHQFANKFLPISNISADEKPTKYDNWNRSLSSPQIEYLRLLSIHFPHLWKSDCTSEKRRFIYIAFQKQSIKFKALGNYVDMNSCQTEGFIMPHCNSIFAEDYNRFSEEYRISGPDKHQYQAYHLDKAKNYNEILKSDQKSINYFLPKADRILVKDLDCYYESHNNIHGAGPAEQYLIYKKSVRGNDKNN